MLLRSITLLAAIFLTFTPTTYSIDLGDKGFDPPKIDAIEGNEPALIILGEADGCICREVPQLFAVCFGRNACEKMPVNIPVTSEALKLMNTHIYQLVPGDFRKLRQLRDLRIEGNFNLSSILPGTFNDNLTNLVNLSISFNPLLRTIEPGVFSGLDNLEHLYLQKNGFEILYDISRAVAPTYLPKLKILSLSENKLTSIREKDLVPMENSRLEELNLVLCRLEYLDPNSFAPLKNLQSLRLGENNFNLSTITNVIKTSIELGIPLKLLNLYSVGFRANFPRELLEAIAASNITHLNFARNQFEVISSDSFPYMPRLRVLDLREVLASDVADDAFKNLPSLSTLLLGGNKFPEIPQGVLLDNLKHLDLQHNSGNTFNPSFFVISNGIFTNMKALVHLNLNFNNIFHVFRKSFLGLTSLEVLGLKNSSIYHIENGTFETLKNLVLLNLENNYFFINNYPFGIYGEIFRGLDNLKVLLLGGNGITFLSRDGRSPFVHLKSLTHLGLEKNELITISPTDFAPLTKLHSIDLSYNLIKAWDKRIFAETKLKSLTINHNKITHFSEAMFNDFSNLTDLKMSFSSVSCECRIYKEFYAWSVKNPGNQMLQILPPSAACLLPLHHQNFTIYTLVDYFTSVENHTIYCNVKEKYINLVIVLPFVLLMLLLVTLAMLVYYYRWHIKYWIFLTRLYLSRKGKLKPNRENSYYNNYLYDAFVSYSNEDRNFVVRLVSMLENYHPFLKLCVYDRDFQVGSIISESVLESVAQSRKTLLVISDSYAKSQWCRWESTLAEYHRLFFEDQTGEYVDDSLILVKLGPISNSHLTPTLKYLLKTRIYLQWEADDRKQKVFWEKLRNALTPPKNGDAVLSTHM